VIDYFAVPVSGEGVPVPPVPPPLVALPLELVPDGWVVDELLPAVVSLAVPAESMSGVLEVPAAPVPPVPVVPVPVPVLELLSHPTSDTPPTASAAAAKRLTNLRMTCPF
jgi:hypothetical protein